MRVYKCDRCGTYYDKKTDRPAVEVHKVISIGANYCDNSPMDICMECYERLLKWMGVDKNGDKIQEVEF